MILIACQQPDLALRWQDTLTGSYEFYDKIITDLHSLELCLKKVSFEAVLIHKPIFGENGVNEVSSLLEIQKALNIVVLCDEMNRREEISAILFGAKAFIKSSTENELLCKTIATVIKNELWVDRNFVTRLLAEIEDITQSRHKEAQVLDKGMESLTPRESEIAELVAMGASNRKVAERLCISERTVKAHLGVIFKKIGIQDRLQLALYINRHKQLSGIWMAKDSDDK